MLVYDRKTKKIEEREDGQEKTLKFLYETYFGRLLLKLFIASPIFSRLKANKQKSTRSQKAIKPFIEKYKIDMSEYCEDYKSFNDFFIRKRKIENNTKDNELVAIADSKLLIYPIDDELKINVKHSIYSIEEILKEKVNIESYKNGYCMIFRLSVDDYHRYAFIDDGEYIKRYYIKGKLHTVRPISSKYKVYSRNSREVSILHTKHLGNIIQIEVGALLIGCIKNNNIEKFRKLDEKGYFEYGGSSIVLLVKNNVQIDKEILENSNKNIETKVKIGERIGKIKYDSND